MLDFLAVCQRIPPYYTVFATCLKLIPNVLSVYKRTCLIFHTSAYVGAIRPSVTGPLREFKKKTYQTPHNHGGVGSGYELVQKIKMGNSIQHLWVNIKCENE